ncbi:MAG: hypothetical protein JWP35_3518 [Caulobacter sp.]|nr:hypothetical protein [Caulobacter sp.]
MAAVSTPSGIDLFAWPAVAEARTRVEAARAAREEAVARTRFIPYGEKEARLSALREASHEALKAEAHLAAVLREAGQ